MPPLRSAHHLFQHPRLLPRTITSQLSSDSPQSEPTLQERIWLSVARLAAFYHEPITVSDNLESKFAQSVKLPIFLIQGPVGHQPRQNPCLLPCNCPQSGPTLQARIWRLAARLAAYFHETTPASANLENKLAQSVKLPNFLIQGPVGDLVSHQPRHEPASLGVSE